MLCSYSEYKQCTTNLAQNFVSEKSLILYLVLTEVFPFLLTLVLLFYFIFSSAVVGSSHCVLCCQKEMAICLFRKRLEKWQWNTLMRKREWWLGNTAKYLQFEDQVFPEKRVKIHVKIHVTTFKGFLYILENWFLALIWSQERGRFILAPLLGWLMASKQRSSYLQSFFEILAARDFWM